MAELRFECKPIRSLASPHTEHSLSQFYCVQSFYNVSSINLNCAMLKMYFIFVRRAVLFGEGGGRVREEVWAQPAFRFLVKMRACSFYNGLILCRRCRFTIVAHN